MTDWDERFRSGDYPQDPEPAPLLKRYVEALPSGRALDVAAGTGRNAVFLAEAGYDVEALDQSREGLRITRERARDRGVADRLDCLQVDVGSHDFTRDRYDLITVSFFRAVDRLPDIVEALADDGVLFYEHHLRSTDEYEAGPSGDRYRFGANELLHAALDLTVLAFDAKTERRDDGRTAMRTQLVARNSTGQAQSYPEVGLDGR
ncbi:bifunctional 2-polyprenyl-6-hydroxyphenol methylase/3-demethylubiquinol 3-O-methyltransferase UbiG [Halogeometricum sp. CBA1124]|uniref:class I SAM-dependent methyltransferase n=1 Tax=Halogeometricum sp. CBA1124 TaxID=2668071 RepID=UPI00142AB762|nr:methyltransferase domain-containing protein [Halogeometricum sp. CBA1124]MUV57646.1 methyltransferase domain-containing protein [Halogeometricum sp. CBA1124]